MNSNFAIRNELDYLLHTAVLCRESKPRHDGVWQVAPFFCSIPYNQNGIEKLNHLKEDIKREFPDLIAYGEKRARRAFRQHKDSVTKPSYIKRLSNFCDRNIDQIANIQDIFSREPYSSGLTFSVFDPGDLLRRRRPGFVPCIVGGSFLVQDGELQLNVFFRSQSILEMGIFDLIFLREFQSQVLRRFKNIAADYKEVQEGSLNLFCSRIFIHRRLVKRNNNFLRRADVVDKWIRIVEAAVSGIQLR